MRKPGLRSSLAALAAAALFLPRELLEKTRELIGLPNPAAGFQQVTEGIRRAAR